MTKQQAERLAELFATFAEQSGVLNKLETRAKFAALNAKTGDTHRALLHEAADAQANLAQTVIHVLGEALAMAEEGR